MPSKNNNGDKVKSMESWIWDAACSIHGNIDAPKYKNFILPLIFVKRLCDVFDDEINRLAEKVKSRTKAFSLVEHDKETNRDEKKRIVRFYLPLKPANPETDAVWDVIRKLTGNVGEQLTAMLRSIAKENPSLSGIIDRVDFNATTHGVREIEDDRLSHLIEKVSEKRLGLKDVEPDIIGRSYEYLIRKFAENGGQSAGEFYTPAEVGIIIAKIMDPSPGMEIYDPTCGSGGLLIKCELVLNEKMKSQKDKFAPLKLFGQEFTPDTWAMGKMNVIIHDMEGDIEIGDTLKTPKFLHRNKLRKFDRVVANPMWNQGKNSLPYINDDFFTEDEYTRFPAGPCGGKIDWGWVQHIYSSLNDTGRAAIVLDTGAASRGSGNQGNNKEKDCRKWFVDNDLLEGVIYLPENLFYNTTAPGIVIFLNKNKKHKEKIFLLHAGKEFEKGDPKNYITEDGIELIANTYNAFKEKEKFSRLVSREEIIKNDYNISPSRYIQVTDAETYRPVEEIIEELQSLEDESAAIDKELKSIFSRMGLND
ncbi:MAG: SAM-dependent DNA methyltransferase [Ignavibacteriaceae bacterium]|nr:SAM-dependent DNA methyltransferase [Ignavibacteriaceae bacterium]